jgi:hypothetical protein
MPLQVRGTHALLRVSEALLASHLLRPGKRGMVQVRADFTLAPAESPRAFFQGVLAARRRTILKSSQQQKGNPNEKRDPSDNLCEDTSYAECRRIEENLLQRKLLALVQRVSEV